MTADLFQNLCRPADEEELVRSTVDGLLSGNAEAHQALLAVPLEAFTSHRARDVWSAVGTLYRKGQPPNIPSIERELWGANRNGAAADLEQWINDSVNGDPTVLAKQVLTLFQRRELFRAFTRASQDCLNLLLDHQETTQALAAHSLGLVSGDIADTVNAWDAMEEKLEQHLKFRECQEHQSKLAWFGLEVLDGDPEDGGVPCAPGHLVIVAARPGLGKTALATQIVGATAHHGEKVFMVSLELGRDEMLQRLAGWFSSTRRGAFTHGTYTYFHSARLRAAKDDIRRVSIWDPAGPSWSRIEAKIRGAALNGFRVVVIDHFSEIDLRTLIPKSGQRREGAMECARRLKITAKELGICIILLSQLNREVPPGEIPGTEHLRETGELEQVAYSIIMLYHQGTDAAGGGRKARGPDADPPIAKPTLRFALVKNRDGKAGYSRALDFDGGSCRMVAHD